MKNIFFAIIAVWAAMACAHASEGTLEAPLSGLKNYQINNASMVSSGQPSQSHLETLKAMGVSKVIDLIPEDRTEQLELMNSLELAYHNIAVDWENPTIDNFHEYVLTMKKFNHIDGITLTHCRVNWRGAVFTYLYRITQLNESKEKAKQDMLAIWQPNETWQAFINDVLAKY